MGELIQAIGNPDIPFLRNALAAGILASVAFGVMGTYVVVRRISYIAGAIAHCVLGGIGAAFYFQTEWGMTWFDPMLGAILSALLAALTIGWVSLYARQREDTVIGALWAVGMAVGLLFLAKTSGYVDPMSYLFGNILLVSKTDLWIVAGMDVLVVGLCTFFYHKFLAVCFDSEFTWLRGVHVEAYYLLLLCMTAVTIVLLVRLVGIVMVIALLTLPAAVAGHFSRRLWQMMLWAVVLCMLFTVLGIGCSYTYDLPSGPTIILFAGLAYLMAVIGRAFQRRTVTDS